MTIKKCAQTFALVLIMAFTFPWNASANNTPENAAAPEIYHKGLIATVYAEDAVTGTWASPTPVGIPVGEFIDKKMPVFAFGNLQQDATAWSMYPGSHIGIEWTGYFYAEETGDYVLMLDFDKKQGSRFYANSCQAILNLSGKTVLSNGYKFGSEDGYYDWGRVQKNRIKSIFLEAGYYPLKFWIHAGVSTGRWNDWIDHADNATWTLKVKRPSDRIIKAATKDMLVWQ